VLFRSGSLSTLYDLLEGKEGVLAAIAIALNADRIAALKAIIQANLEPRETLLSMASTLQSDFFGPERLAIMRILMAETFRDPKLGLILQDQCYAQVENLLNGLLVRWHDEQKLRVAEPALATDLLFGMLFHRPLKKSGSCHAPCSIEESRKLAHVAIDMFLNYYAPDHA
jgi:hypothetical protein